MKITQTLVRPSRIGYVCHELSVRVGEWYTAADRYDDEFSSFKRTKLGYIVFDGRKRIGGDPVDLWKKDNTTVPLDRVEIIEGPLDENKAR